MIRQRWFPQSITTKYLGPTNYRGGRIKATATGGRSVTLAWSYELGIEGNHTAAASALAAKLCKAAGGDGWDGEWIGGGLNEGGHVYVSIPKDGARAFSVGVVGEAVLVQS